MSQAAAPHARPKPSRRPLVAVALLAQVGKRLGLGRQVVRLMFRHLLSPEMKRRAFAGYRPTRHDVFVATFGKSGTNWMLQIAQQIAWRSEAEFRHIHDVVPWPDAPGRSSLPLSDTSARERSPTGLRVIKTHLETAYVPYSEEATYLTVLRDPKEVLVSSYFFLGGLIGVLRHVSIDDWCEIFLEPGSMGAAWAQHTASYWAWRDRPNVRVLMYPDIEAEPRRAIASVAEVMGVELSEAELARVVERSDFAYMKAHESQFAPPRLPFVSEPVAMIRQGRSGRSGEQLSEDQRAAVDRLCAEELRRLGSDCPYAEMFGARRGAFGYQPNERMRPGSVSPRAPSPF